MKLKFRLQIGISLLLILMIMIVGGVIGGISYFKSKDLIEANAEESSQLLTQDVLSSIQGLISPANVSVKLLSYSSITSTHTIKQRLDKLPLLKETLDDSEWLSSIYIGYDTGDFFLMRDILNDADRARMNAPPGTRYMVQSIERSTSPPAGLYIYFDDSLKILSRVSMPEYPQIYDPRKRAWYARAFDSTDTVITPPSRFFSDRKIGITIAKKAANGRAVIGSDVKLETLSNYLVTRTITPNTKLVLTDSQGLVIADGILNQSATRGNGGDDSASLVKIDNMGTPILEQLGDTIRNLKSQDPYSDHVSLDGVDWGVSIFPLQLKGAGTFYLVSAIPTHELLKSAYRLLSTTAWVTISILLLMIPLALLVASSISKPLRLLSKEADSIEHFNFSETTRVKSMIVEVDDVAKAMEKMKVTINHFLQTIEVISSESDFDKLLPILLTEAISNGEAKAGILYLTDQNQLIPASALFQGESFSDALPSISLDAMGSLMRHATENEDPYTGELSNAESELIGLDKLPLLKQLNKCVVVPLRNRQKNLLGVILLMLDRSIEDNHLAFIKALNKSSAISLETRELIKSQKELFEAFIQLLAGAIDAKSPYTGGHCKRVPDLTKMLAKAACEEKSGPFSDFNLNEYEWEQLHIAAWLHDCGKIITPVDVVDKSTKLEMIYDRIHEIRMRFEVLKCYAKIKCLEKITAGTDEQTARDSLIKECQQLDDDYAFVASCNEGGEFMSADRMERLKAIGDKTWIRTIDNRLGVSTEERQRMGQTEQQQLPIIESLLADKPEHRILRKENDRRPADNPWGFTMAEPELLYNKGELYNLSVARGTLSNEERYKVNEHITQTIMMLSSLPFPKHLRMVPEIAGGHHEKMDGTGYPKGLKKDELSPLARMMAIADIFEALTAVDRPYKKGKKLSEAIQIMSFMKKDQHIDPDLFELFLRSGIYLQYAKNYLNPNQIDDVDIQKYLS